MLFWRFALLYFLYNKVRGILLEQIHSKIVFHWRRSLKNLHEVKRSRFTIDTEDQSIVVLKHRLNLLGLSSPSGDRPQEKRRREIPPPLILLSSESIRILCVRNRTPWFPVFDFISFRETHDGKRQVQRETHRPTPILKCS